MSKSHLTVNGLMLIDAPHSALNMLGTQEGQNADNVVVVKNIQRAGQLYPYVSAQALRYWWRLSLEREKGWTLSPITVLEGKNQAFTDVQPWKYEDDDVFGYMRAQKIEVADIDNKTGKQNLTKAGEPKTKSQNATLTRVSPLKCSPLVSVSPQRPTRDLSNMSRGEGNPVLFEKQFYSTVLQGIFSLDLTSLGHFGQVNRTGFLNIDQKGLEEAQAAGASVEDKEAVLPLSERQKRAKDTISVLPHLVGGANQTLHLTDVTPKLVILTVLQGGNHLFMNVVKDDRGRAFIHADALKEVLRAYKDRLKTDVFIGRRTGFMDDQAEALADLNGEGMPTVHVDELNAAITKFTKAMANTIE